MPTPLKKEKRSSFFIGLSLLALLSFLVIAVYAKSIFYPAPIQPPEEMKKTATQTTLLPSDLLITKAPGEKINYPPITSSDPQKGESAAPITIIEFSDFGCPACRMVQDTLKQVEASFPDQVRFVWKDFPILTLHPQSQKAHEAARCAGLEGQFWPFHDKLFQNQDKLSRPLYLTLAQELNLDLSRFNYCLDSNQMTLEVERNFALGRALEIASTPYFFINKKRVWGAISFEEFSQIILQELTP